MNNEIQYTLNNTTIIDRFRSEDKAELLLSLYLLDKTLSGDLLPLCRSNKNEITGTSYRGFIEPDKPWYVLKTEV